MLYCDSIDTDLSVGMSVNVFFQISTTHQAVCGVWDHEPTMNERCDAYERILEDRANENIIETQTKIQSATMILNL